MELGKSSNTLKIVHGTDNKDISKDKKDKPPLDTVVDEILSKFQNPWPEFRADNCKIIINPLVWEDP